MNTRILKIAQKSRQASHEVALLSSAKKKQVLMDMAKAIVLQQELILKANAKDLVLAKRENYAAALIDRLTLNSQRVLAIAEGIKQTAVLPEPVGRILETIQRPNGLQIKKITVPLGVVGIIFESRPNVTADCASLCFKSGNAVILKGGKEAQETNRSLAKIICKVLQNHDISPDAIQLLEANNRQDIYDLLSLHEYIDVIVPRGGESLIRAVTEHSRIPVIKHYKGVCHVFVSRFADLEMAESIVLNAKTQKPGVCNAMETLLIDQRIAARWLPVIADKLRKARCQIKGDAASRRICAFIQAAKEDDWSTEYLDLILNVAIVDNLKAAIGHINGFGSHHSDAIVTKNKKEAEQFLNQVDSACVYVNASTRFTDGFEFGFGSEVGISTDKIHVRGPMGLEGLTSYKYQIEGKGQIRV